VLQPALLTCYRSADHLTDEGAEVYHSDSLRVNLSWFHRVFATGGSPVLGTNRVEFFQNDFEGWTVNGTDLNSGAVQ
jgi:hypothetical protein